MWKRSRSPLDLKSGINVQAKARKRKVSKFIFETNRYRKGWDSGFSNKPKRVKGENKNTVKFGNRILHKKDVGQVTEAIATKLFQFESKQEEPFEPSGKEKTIFTVPGGQFVFKICAS